MHEAGHFFLGIKEGFSSGPVELFVGANHGYYEAFVGCHFGGQLHNLEAVSEYLWKRSRVVYAGILAESLHEQRVIGTLAECCKKEISGIEDFAKAEELIRLLGRLEAPGLLDEVDLHAYQDTTMKKAWSEAKAIIEGNSKVIGAIASCFLDTARLCGIHYTLSEEDIMKLLLSMSVQL
jgi:hypothetical protein